MNETKHSNYQELLNKKHWWQKFSPTDLLFIVVILVFSLIIRTQLLHTKPNIYEEMIFISCVVIVIFLGYLFKALQWFIPLLASIFYGVVLLYGGQIENSEKFLLKYLFSSQTAIMWQCVLIVLAFGLFTAGAFLLKNKNQNTNTLISSATALAWAGAFMGFLGLFVRWHESYLISTDAGHMPVSNLYEVLILFMATTALMFLYYAGKHRLHRLGVFVYLLQALLVLFFVFYAKNSNVSEIQPLVSPLRSWWMKIHVPANFVGYGGFCLAAMLAIAELLAIRQEQKGIKSYFLPTSSTIEDVMYKSIAIGFLFFTIATILGALWAADAWGRYWGWDPKETWALIVWLNYAIWLHMRLIAGWRGKLLAWWALIGLLITLFAFIGVNKYLTGLHSYGGL